MAGLPSLDELDVVTLSLGIPPKDIDALDRVVDRLKSVQCRRKGPEYAAPDQLLRLAETAYRFRRFREKVFNELAFSDPSWDILLDLFIADERGKKISVSSACIGAAVPSTTALRHLSSLVALGLIRRFQSPDDARVVNVELTTEGRAKVVRVLSFLPRAASVNDVRID